MIGKNFFKKWKDFIQNMILRYAIQMVEAHPCPCPCHSHDHIIVEHHYHFDVFNKPIDFVLTELNARFNDTGRTTLSQYSFGYQRFIRTI